MSAHYRNPPAILGAFVLLLCFGTDLAAQSRYAPATAGDAVQQQPQPLIRKFTFKHARAADVLKILQQLAGPSDHIGLKIAVDERTNSLVFQPEDDRQSRYFEETCTLLDAETPAPGNSGNGLSISIPALGPHPLAFDFAFGIARGESLESLKQRYNELEQQAHQLADKLRQSKSPSKTERKELQTAVRKSFEARQALQRAELADLAQRMQSMQQSIDMRDKLVDKVIERRVENLLNPNLKWDAGKVSEQLLTSPKQSSSNAAMPLPPSPLPASVSAPYVPGEPPATVIRKRIQGRWIVQTFSVGDKDALPEFAGQVEVVVEGNSMRYLVGKQELTGPIFLANCKESESPTLAEDGPLPIDFIHEPNGDPQTSRGIIACDETTLSICMASDEGTANKVFRPLLFVPGTKVILIKCHRAEPETANAVSVDEATWKSAVEQATSKLLLAYRVPPNIDPNESPKVIALIDVDYQGKQEAVDLKEEIYEWIEDDVPVASPGRFTLLSRKFVDWAMIETRLRPSDLASSSPSFLENRQRILEHIRRHEVKLDSLLIPSLKHLGDSDVTRQNVFELTLEGYINAQTSWIERVTLVRELRDHANQANKSNADKVSPATPAKVLQDRLQGTWDVKTFQMDYQGDVRVSQLVIRGDLLLVNTIVDGKVLGTSPWKLVWPNSDAPFEIEAIWDPNSKPATTEGMPGRIAYDGKSFQIAFGGKRPNAICPGEEITYIDCVRATVPTENADQTAKGDLDLSTPQATLDTIHRYSVDHPMGVPVECYTEAALQELSGVMLQQLCFMSGLSQIGLQTGGVIGVKDNVPIVAGTAPSFHLSVDALLKEHSLPTPPKECTNAFELLAKLTLGAAFGSDESLVKPDRELFRLAAGILKSPKEFLPKAGELSERFNNISGDSKALKKESKAQPKYLIEIDGDEATATQIVDSDKPSVPMSFKLQRINQRWLVSEAFSDEILNQMISSMSQVLGALSAIESEVANQRDSSDSKNAPDAVGANNASPPEWDDFLKLLPESGTTLVMFSYEPEIKEQMLPVAKKVTEAASAQLIDLPQATWHKIIAPPATHFVLMKDRQLVGTRTGLMTEARLQDFVAKAKDWLTPRSTGIAENSLVRIDCFISPGTDNIGSQHGGASPLTTVVVAVHEDQALLFGPESIAEYIEKGYACVAVVRDAYGNQKQVPMDVLLNGPVKLLGRSEKQTKSAASMKVTFGDDTSREVPLPVVSSIYPKSVTELLEAYDVGSAIYHIRGVQGLKPVRLAAIKDAPLVNQRVLSGSFSHERHVPPLHGFRSPIDWQSQTVRKNGAHVYGDNINGAEMFEVLCPTRPAPCGFTFNEHGRLIGKYGLGEPSEKDMTHTVFKPDTTHSVLQAALEKISDAGLKVALAQTLEESHESFRTSMNEPSDAGETVNLLYSGHPISWWLEKYWQNAMATPKTSDNETEEFVATIAIRKLCEMPECDSVIETELSKWYTSVEHEVNEGQLTRSAKYIVTVAGPAHQETAVNLLFKIWKRMPLLTYEVQGKMADDETELNQLLSQLVLNEQLAAQFADRLTNGDSSDRSLVLYGLLSLMGRFGVETNKDLTELENWLRKHAEQLAPAVEAASHDANEQIRFTSLIQLATLFHVTKLDPEFVRLPKILLTAASDASPNVRYIAIELLTSNELAPAVESQNIEIAPLMIKTLESDSSVDVRYAALGALMAMDKDSELVHATLLEWARCKERVQVENALSLMLRYHEAGDRPQSIDELIELLSDPEWGTKVEVNYNNWSTHHRWARQYAFAILGQYAAHAHRAIPTLEAELACNNKDTLSFATQALDRVRGYCPDFPIDKLQGEWEFVSMQWPEGSSPFFDLQASSGQPSSVITISGTQLKLGDRVLAELSHYRSGSRQGVALLLDPDGKKRHCHGGYNFKGGPSPEYKPNATPSPELLILEVSELLNNWDATHATKQIYEFRRVKK